MKKALITWGGWDGHEPEQVSRVYEDMLKENGYEVKIHDSLDCFDDTDLLNEQDLIIPVITMSTINKDQVNNVSEAVASGAGIAGCHGGMCDAFRESVLWQFVTGGNWVAHPGGDGVEFTVNVSKGSSPITEGINDFQVTSEQYYLHVDPAVNVLATTHFPIATWYHSANGPVDMPVVWTKMWGLGRVFYNSLGHHADVFDIPEAADLMKRGLLWAGQGRAFASESGLKREVYENSGSMF